MPPRQPPDRHHEVDRGEEQDLAGDADPVEQPRRHPTQPVRRAEQQHLVRGERLQRARDERHHEQPDAEDEDEAVGNHRGDQPVALRRAHAVVEDHRHRALQRAERERAEHEQRDEQDAADRHAVGEERCERRHHGVAGRGRDQFDVAIQRRQELVAAHDEGQREHEQDQQRDDRQQRVVGDRAGEQQPLVAAELAQHLAREGDGVPCDREPGMRTHVPNLMPRRTSGRTAEFQSATGPRAPSARWSPACASC